MSTTEVRHGDGEVFLVPFEGNIGARKSTTLRAIEPYIQESLRIERDDYRDLSCPRANVIVVLEPVGALKEVVGTVSQQEEEEEPRNLLEAFYAEPQKYAMSMQVFMFMRRTRELRDAVETWRQKHDNGGPLYVLCERSVFSDRHLFVAMLRADQVLSELEVATYAAIWDDWFNDRHPGSMKHVVYLRSSPQKCHERLLKRARPEERNVPLAYLSALHDAHERVLAQDDVVTDNDNIPWPNAIRLTVDSDELGELTEEHVARKLAQRIARFLCK